jgi:hypothetical protein
MTIQLKRDTAANWASVNPVMASGQPGYDTTNKLLKIGDGVTAWSSLTGIGAGTGSVSSVSVATANGFAGSVANPTTTPAITVSTTISGLLKGNGTAISAATAGTDYLTPTTVLTNTTASFTTAQETKLSGIAAGAEVNVNADWNSISGDSQILNKPTLGTSSVLDVPASGDASGTQVVKGNDTRLTDSRAPTSHTHTVGELVSVPTASLVGRYTVGTGVAETLFLGANLSASGGVLNVVGISGANAFETTSKNLVSANVSLNYTSGVLTSIVYANGITKTFTYSSGILTTITLSGTTPPGILLNKNLNYSSGILTSISYS